MTPPIPVPGRCATCDRDIVSCADEVYERHGDGWRRHERYCSVVLDEIARARLRRLLDVVPIDYLRCALNGHIRIVEIERAVGSRPLAPRSAEYIRSRLWHPTVDRALNYWARVRGSRRWPGGAA